MIKATDDLVDKLAHLARLEFENEAKEEIKKDMQQQNARIDKLYEMFIDLLKDRKK